MLNENYYIQLIDKYSVLPNCNNTVCLTISAILTNYRSRNVHFNFPKHYDFSQIINVLYEEFSMNIFTKHADFTTYTIGDRMKRIREKGKNIYIITETNGMVYNLKKEDNSYNTIIQNITRDCLKRNYIKIKQSTNNSTFIRYRNYFKKVNEFGFLPTHFSKKIVLIAGQTMWSNLSNKNCIPSVYLPNTREGEQTIRKSIEAFEDCIAYVTPKYEVCYEEILKKNITIDTIIVCETDISTIVQILQDQSKYSFKLIILSNKNEAQKFNHIFFWNWQKEEIELIERRSTRHTEINVIKDKEIDNLINHFEDCIRFISTLEMPIRLKDYGYFLRVALNTLHDEQFDYLLMRLKNNKELERNEGGYDDFAEYNPKESLKEIILYLKEHRSKLEALNDAISKLTKDAIIVADREDFGLLNIIRNSKCRMITNTELKRLLKNGEAYNKTIIFYSFNGLKDYNMIYSLPCNVRLILFNQEKELYLKQQQLQIKQLETELRSEDRLALCGIKYQPIVEQEIKVSPTLEQIIERLEQRSNTAYESYKNESDSLLDDLEEEINYNVTMSNGEIWEMQSNETVFDHKGNLLKTYKLQENIKIRIYPKDLAENLIEIAIAEEPEIFGKVEEHAALWRNALKELEKKYYNREELYNQLKQKGLRVLPATVDAYFRGIRKFPMYNTDLKAILELSNNSAVFAQLKKSKKMYNSTTSALGRGIKQELKQFLQQKTLGEILTKKQFSKETLQVFIEEKMPLLTIIKIEESSDEQ